MIGLSNEDYRDLVLSVGTHRNSRRLSPLEVGKLLARAMASGATRQDCATGLHIGVTQVRTFLRLLDLDPKVQQFADWSSTKNATIPFSTMAELARLSPQDQVQAVDSVLRHNLTWKEVVQLVQIAKRSDKAIDECIADVLNLRPEVVTRHLFVGAITSEHLARHIRATDQAERDRLFARVINQLVGSDFSARGRLGDDKFTILSDHDFPHHMGTDPDELEKTINELLESLRPYQ